MKGPTIPRRHSFGAILPIPFTRIRFVKFRTLLTATDKADEKTKKSKCNHLPHAGDYMTMRRRRKPLIMMYRVGVLCAQDVCDLPRIFVAMGMDGQEHHTLA